MKLRARSDRDWGTRVFSAGEQFADLIGPDNKRLAGIGNNLPGVKPVKKFPNRKAATERIWNAIQQLGGKTPFDPIETSPNPDRPSYLEIRLPASAKPR